MFESFLSKDMTYSCAIFGPEEGGPEGDLAHVVRKIAPVKGVDELEAAQMRKLRTIIERARISKGDRVLEIGSGWGSLAIEVRSVTTGCFADANRRSARAAAPSTRSPSPSSRRFSPRPASPPLASPRPSLCTFWTTARFPTLSPTRSTA